MLPEFEDLLNLFTSKKILVRIHSSGIKFSKAVEQGLKNNSVIIVISPDTAIDETYKRIKRVNCCEKVWQNLEIYAKSQMESNRVKLKFIIIPGYNDSIEEIDAFLARAKMIGIKHVIREIEGAYAAIYNYEIPHVSMLLDYAVEQTKKNNFSYEFYDNAIYVQNKKENVEQTDNKNLFEKKYNDIKNQYKYRNLNYIEMFEQ